MGQYSDENLMVLPPTVSSIYAGQRFGHWQVLDATVYKVSDGKWRPRRALECVCKCGKVQMVLERYLREGKSKACKSCAAVLRPSRKSTASPAPVWKPRTQLTPEGNALLAAVFANPTRRRARGISLFEALQNKLVIQPNKIPRHLPQRRKSNMKPIGQVANSAPKQRPFIGQVAQLIRETREKKGLSQKDIAHLFGFDWKSAAGDVSHRELGRYPIRLSKTKPQMAEFLNLSVELLDKKLREDDLAKVRAKLGHKIVRIAAPSVPSCLPQEAVQHTQDFSFVSLSLKANAKLLLTRSIEHFLTGDTETANRFRVEAQTLLEIASRV